MKRILLSLLMIPLLSSCQYIKNAPTSLSKREYMYLNAKNEPPLRVPHGVNGNRFRSEYPASAPSQSLGRLNLAPKRID